MQEIFQTEFAIAHLLDHLLQSEWLNHYVLRCDEETRYGCQLEVTVWHVWLASGVVSIHKRNCLEHKALLCDFEFRDDFKEPINDPHPKLSTNLWMLSHMIDHQLFLFTMHHRCKLLISIACDKRSIKLRQKSSLNKVFLLVEQILSVNVALLLDLIDLQIQRIFGLSPECFILVPEQNLVFRDVPQLLCLVDCHVQLVYLACSSQVVLRICLDLFLHYLQIHIANLDDSGLLLGVSLEVFGYLALGCAVV